MELHFASLVIMRNGNNMKGKTRCKECGWWIGHDERCEIAQNCVHTFAGSQRNVKIYGLKRKIKCIQCIHCGLTRFTIMKLNEDKLPHQI